MQKLFRVLSRSKKKNLNEIRGLGKLTLGQIGSGLVKGGLAVGAYKLAFGGKGDNSNPNTNTKTDTPNITVDKKNKKEDKNKRTKIPFEQQIKDLGPVKDFYNKQDETQRAIERLNNNEY